jgi:hypothetical protein
MIHLGKVVTLSDDSFRPDIDRAQSGRRREPPVARSTDGLHRQPGLAEIP